MQAAQHPHEACWSEEEVAIDEWWWEASRRLSLLQAMTNGSTWRGETRWASSAEEKGCGHGWAEEIDAEESLQWHGGTQRMALWMNDGWFFIVTAKGGVEIWIAPVLDGIAMSMVMVNFSSRCMVAFTVVEMMYSCGLSLCGLWVWSFLWFGLLLLFCGYNPSYPFLRPFAGVLTSIIRRGPPCSMRK